MKKRWNLFALIRILLAAMVFLAAWGAAWFYPDLAKLFVTQYGSGFLSLFAHISVGAV